MLSKVEVDVLQYLFKNQFNSKMNSQTIRDMSIIINLNYFRLRNIVGHLCQLQLISLGYKDKNANSYYISPKAIEMIKKGDDIQSSPLG